MTPVATLSEHEARSASLQAADGLFYRRGVSAVTMADVRDDSGVSLRRLYAMYPSKSDLVAAWLRFRHDAFMAGFVERVDRRLAAGEPPIDALFSALEQWMSGTDFRGCGFINTHAESSELTDEQLDVIRTHKRALADYLMTLSPFGSVLAVIVDGAIVQATIFADPEPIRLAHRAASALTTEGTR